MSENMRETIRNSINLRETDELVEIWKKNDRNDWSDLAFDVLQEILQERLGELPLQEKHTMPISESESTAHQNEVMKDNIIDQTGLGLWIKWVAATALAFIINDGSQFFIPNQFILSFLYLFFVEGLVIAIFQSRLVLRFLTSKDHLWQLFTPIGYGIGWLIGSLSVGRLPRMSSEAQTLIALFIHGALLGSIQWAFFLRKLYSKSFLWILANAIGLPVAFGLSWFVIFPLVFGNYDSVLLGFLDSAVRGILFGSLTGALLIRLSRSAQGEVVSSALKSQ